MSILFRFAAEALDGAESLLFASVADKPPRRFGGEEDEDQKRGLDESALVGPRREGRKGTHGEDPLQSKRHSPGPLIISLIVGVRGGGDNDTTDRPAHLQSSRTGPSKDERNDLASVGG